MIRVEGQCNECNGWNPSNVLVPFHSPSSPTLLEPTLVARLSLWPKNKRSNTHNSYHYDSFFFFNVSYSSITNAMYVKLQNKKTKKKSLTNIFLHYEKYFKQVVDFVNLNIGTHYLEITIHSVVGRLTLCKIVINNERPLEI